MRRRSEHLGKRAGYGLLEVTIGLALLGSVMASAFMVSKSSSDAYRAASLSSQVDTQVRRTVERIAAELTLTGPNVMFPDPSTAFGESLLNFQQVEGVTAGVVNWSPLVQVGFEYETGEVDDGADNNGNGLVDEGVVVLTKDVGGPNEKRVVLCHGVRELLEGELGNGADDNGNGLTDETGFNLHRDGQILTIRLTVEDAAAAGELRMRTVETAVLMRN